MRFEQQQSQAGPPSLPEHELLTQPELQARYVHVEGEPFRRQIEMIDAVRQLGAEEEFRQYTWEDYGEDLDSIADTHDDDDDDDDTSSITFVGEEGCYFSTVDYVYPKPT